MIRFQPKYRARPGWYDSDLLPTTKEKGRYYFDSQLEVLYARRLKALQAGGIIAHWDKCRKKESWDFNARSDKPFRANSQYRPDFYITEKSGHQYWVECKGAPQGIVKIRRALKYYPERELRVFTVRCGEMSAVKYLETLNRRSIKRAA